MSNRLKELRLKQEQLMADARSRLDEINANTDESRAAELETQHDAAMDQYDQIGKQIEREERYARVSKTDEEQRARRRPIPGDTETSGDDGDENLTYRSVFHKFMSNGADPSELTSEERSVLRSGVDADAAKQFRAQGTVTGPAGGYTVPTELNDTLVETMKAWGPMYDEDICTVLNTASGNAFELPTVDDTSEEADKHTENADLLDDGSKDVIFGKKVLNAYVFDTGFIRFSFELAQDSILNMETTLGGLLGKRLGRTANKQLTIGDGVDDPNGVVTASLLGKTAAAAAALTYDDVIDLTHSVDPAYRQSPKTRYMFNDTTLGVLRKIKDGEGRYILSSGDVTKDVPATLLGYRYSINQAMANVAAGQRSMLFGDFGAYYVRKVGLPVIGVLRERFWPNLGIAGLIRFDGELSDNAAIKHMVQGA